MAVIKSYDNHFIDVRRAFALRADLSLKLKGLLLFLLAIPDEWGFDTDSLHEHLGESAEELESMLTELVKEGYLVIMQEEDGSHSSYVFDFPQPAEDAEGEDE